MKKINELNALATEMVGDGKKPNLYFVTNKGNVATVTQHFEVAHREWSKFASQRVECALEDRLTGIICSSGMERLYDHDTSTF